MYKLGFHQKSSHKKTALLTTLNYPLFLSATSSINYYVRYGRRLDVEQYSQHSAAVLVASKVFSIKHNIPCGIDACRVGDVEGHGELSGINRETPHLLDLLLKGAAVDADLLFCDRVIGAHISRISIDGSLDRYQCLVGRE